MALIKGLQKATKVNPTVLLIFAAPKTGKTHALIDLDNHLLLDFDGTKDYYDCNGVTIKNYKTFVDTISELKELKKANTTAGKAGNEAKPFKYIILDTITEALDTVIREMAVRQYNKDEGETKPASWDITSLAYGKGHGYIRENIKKLIKHVKPYAEYIIVVGHVADKAITVQGNEVTIKELDLSGKAKNILAAHVDALGLLYRGETNTNMLSFKHENELLAGTRSTHLSNNEFVISELNPETKELTTHWDKIYLEK